MVRAEDDMPLWNASIVRCPMTPQEAEELAVLWTGAQPVVVAFIRTLVPHRDQAEELLQQTAVVLVRRFQEYDRDRSFVGWAIGIAKMKVLSYRREQAVHRVVFDGALVEQIAEDYRQVAEERLPDRDLLVQCLVEMEERAREAIQLRYAEQMKTPQIAERLGLSPGATRVLLTRARTTLRVCVEKYLKRLKA
jgi:RNA polymerase sigma-70 factor, ECF subfamily